MAKKELDKLSQEMLQCEADGFGFHYGAWKATQEPGKPPQPKIDKNISYCLNCGRIIILKSRREVKYCDAYCGMDYRYKRDHGLLEEGADNG